MIAPVAVSGVDRGVEIFGVRLLGVDEQSLRKLLFTIGLFVVLYAVTKLLGVAVGGAVLDGRSHQRVQRFATTRD